MLHHILFVCNACLSVASVRNTSSRHCGFIRDGGKVTSVFSIPPNVAALLPALSGGMLFNPHSSYGMR